MFYVLCSLCFWIDCIAMIGAGLKKLVQDGQKSFDHDSEVLLEFDVIVYVTKYTFCILVLTFVSCSILVIVYRYNIMCFRATSLYRETINYVHQYQHRLCEKTRTRKLA